MNEPQQKGGNENGFPTEVHHDEEALYNPSFCLISALWWRAQNIESTENIRVFGGFLRAKGVFLEKNDGDRGVFPVFGKTLFVWKLFELGASEGLLEAVWAFLRRLRFEVCFSRVFTGFWRRFS